MNFLLAFFITSFSAIVVYFLYKLQSVVDRLDGFQKEIDSLDRDIGYLSKSFKESINLFPTTSEKIEKDQELSDKAPLDNFYKVSIIPGSSIEKELNYYIGCIKSKCRGKYIRRIDLPIVTNKIVSSKAVSNAEYSRGIRVNKITVGRFCLYPVDEFLEWLRGYILYGTGVLKKFRKEFPYNKDQQ